MYRYNAKEQIYDERNNLINEFLYKVNKIILEKSRYSNLSNQMNFFDYETILV